MLKCLLAVPHLHELIACSCIAGHHFPGLMIFLMWQTQQLPYSLSGWGWGNFRTMPSAPCFTSGHASPVLPSFSFAPCLLGSVARRPWCPGPPLPPWEKSLIPTPHKTVKFTYLLQNSFSTDHRLTLEPTARAQLLFQPGVLRFL